MTIRNTATADACAWARKEFGSAALGHRARTKRAVAMAARIWERPSGLVTRMFTDQAERDGAYGALENPAFGSSGLIEASTVAATQRADRLRKVFIPVDPTSLSFPSSPADDLSEIGNKRSRSKGVHLYNSAVIGDDGQLLGIGHQVYYRRIRRKHALRREERRKLELKKKETRHWLTCIRRNEEAFRREQIDTPRCYLLDRGADFRQMLAYSVNADHEMIIRSSWDRRLESDGIGQKEKKYLRSHLAEAIPLGWYLLDVRAGEKRTARQALMEVRAQPVTFRLEDRKNNQVLLAPLWAVYTGEISAVPDGEDPLEWRLITNRETTSFRDAVQVIDDYTMRWRIEEMHRCWKTVCGIEQTRLRTLQAIIKLAVLMASVAARIEQIKTVSRAEPEAPASRLFSQVEIEAIAVLHSDDGQPQSRPELTTQQAVEWLARLGGYTGPQNGPPGAETIGRGMLIVQTAVEVLVKTGWTHDLPPPFEKN